MISNDERFRFDISPEPRYANVNVSEGNFVDVVFTVQNRSHRAVRVEAIVNALTGPNDSRGEPLPTEIWSDWFTVLGAQELYFDNTSVKHITVRITLPNRLLYGVYKFQLLIVGVDDPDEELAESDTVAVKVSGSGINVGRFVVIALLILAVIILLAVGAALIFQPRPRLDVNLAAPLNATPGKVANYTVTIKNARQSDATNVALHYKLPEGVIGATAFVPNAAFRYCEEDVRDIHCNLGTLKADETKIVQIDFIPGPFPTYPATITNTETVTVTSSLDDQSASTPAAVKIQTTEILTPTELSVAIDPSVATAVLDEPVTYNVMAWNNITDTDVLTLTYHLPAKMHYEDPIPKRCELLDDYFTMICVSDKLNYNSANPDIASFVIKAIPADTATAFTSKVTDVEYVTSEGVKPDFDGEDSTNLETLGATVDTRTVNSALQFNGIDDWVELGYQKAPENFTVEMWVHPVSTNDGQSFIGAHKLDEFEEDVQNVFLAGYWEDGLHINLNGESHTLADMKMTDRFHLAVVVKKRDNDSSEVTVYVDGRLVNDWVDGNEDDSLCDGCIIFEETLDGSQTLPWVLGQDWDQGSQGPIPSDFFHGSLNDVRIWETALGQDEIQRYMQLRPPVDSPGLVANWRLEPVTPDSPVLVDRINTANNGTRKGHVGWGEPVTRFGSALVFDGLSDLLFYTPPQEPLAENNGETAVEELDDAAVAPVDPWQVWHKYGASQAALTDNNAVTTTNIITTSMGPWISVNNIITTTMSAWVFVEGTPSVEQLILGTFDKGIVALAIDNDGHVVAVTQSPDDQTWHSKKDEQVIPANRWVHYAVVFDAETDETGTPQQRITLYRNGQVQKGVRSQWNPLEQLEFLACLPGVYIGGGCTETDRLKLAGRLDEVRLWNRALDQDEIDSWRNLPGIMFNEVAYWPFDDSPNRSGTKACVSAPGAADSQFTCALHYDATALEGQGAIVSSPTTVEGPTWIEADSRLEQQFLERQ